MGSNDVNASGHAVAGPSMGDRAGYRLFWGKGADDEHLSLDTPLISDSVWAELRAKSTVSESAFRAEMPAAWKTWYDALSSGQRDDVRRGVAAE